MIFYILSFQNIICLYPEMFADNNDLYKYTFNNNSVLHNCCWYVWVLLRKKEKVIDAR